MGGFIFLALREQGGAPPPLSKLFHVTQRGARDEDSDLETPRIS